MKNIEFETVEKVIKENVILKEEIKKILDEKEKIILLTEQILSEKEKIERRYNNLKNSKLGRITVWYWGRKGKRNVKK